jgi:hypothetical protein
MNAISNNRRPLKLLLAVLFLLLASALSVGDATGFMQHGGPGTVHAVASLGAPNQQTQEAPLVQAIQQRFWRQQAGLVVGVASIEDGAGNTIEAVGFQDGGTGRVHLEIRQRDTGTVLDQIDVTPAPSPYTYMKVDRIWLWLRGSKAVVLLGNHENSEPPPGQYEGLSVDAYLWPSPFIVPIPFGSQQQPMGRGGFYPLEAETTGGVTMDELVAALNNNASPFAAALRVQLKDRAMSAIDTRQVLTLNNIGTSDGLYQRLSDTGGEQIKLSIKGGDAYHNDTRDALKLLVKNAVKEALQEYGVCKAP